MCVNITAKAICALSRRIQPQTASSRPSAPRFTRLLWLPHGNKTVNSLNIQRVLDPPHLPTQNSPLKIPKAKARVNPCSSRLLTRPSEANDFGNPSRKGHPSRKEEKCNHNYEREDRLVPDEVQKIVGEVQYSTRPFFFSHANNQMNCGIGRRTPT